MIYVLQIEDHRFIKVGYTSSEEVGNRIAQLQTGNPYEIKPVMVVPGTIDQERELHRSMKELMLSCHMTPLPNEWYPGKHHAMRLVLVELRSGADYALAFIDAYKEGRQKTIGGAKKEAWIKPKDRAIPAGGDYMRLQDRLMVEATGATLLKRRRERAAERQAYAGNH